MSALSDKMRELADLGHLRADELREKAEAFDVASSGFYAEPQTVEVKPFLGTWARARKVWCECSGEALI
jgi:hypothetical protein